jgi:enamine deaminase RidA (YjgF/YER057c/UK114 family)
MNATIDQFLKQIIRWIKQVRWLALMIGVLILVVVFIGTSALAGVRPPRQVIFYGNPESSISSAVAVPRFKSYFFTSGIVPPRLADGTYAPTTYEQAVGTLEQIKGILEEAGLSLSDVIYLTAYLTADPAMGKVDYSGWFQAYGEYFNNDENPVKTARATLGVQSLVLPDWRIEISAIAVYPRN